MDLISSILAEKVSDQSPSEKVIWFVRLLKWIQGPKSKDEKLQQWDKVYTTRIKYILYQLQNNPQWADQFSRTMSSVILELAHPYQLVFSGMSKETSFVQDLFYRIQERLLPQTPIADDIGSILLEVFSSEDESLLIDAIDEGVLSDLIQVLNQSPDFRRKLQKKIIEALKILGLLISQEEILIRNRLFLFEDNVSVLSEFELTRHILRLDGDVRADDIQVLRQTIESIEEQNQVLFGKLSAQGVQIETVYLFQSQNQKIKRFKLLMNFLDPKCSGAISLRLFISQLILEVHESRGFIAFLSQNLYLIGQRIVQANSYVGEHYIARTWRGFKEMLFSAMGGGVITAFTVFLKVFISGLSLAGFLKGLLYSLNYSGSFLAIQMMGFTLATKQPSTTAPFLAKTIAESVRNGGRTFIDLIRTQVVAIIGNLLTVFPICFIVSWIFVLIGHPLLTNEEATSIFRSSQFFGPSVIFACFTGVLLFLSSLVAGWFENFCHVTQLPRRVQYNKKINRILGRIKTEKLGRLLSEKSNLLAGNISLGFFLGLSPQILKFLGLPLDVRHITLATGGFAATLPIVLESDVALMSFLNSVMGLFLIGIGNVGVSFFLAILLATASAPMVKGRIIKVLQVGFSRLLRRPWLFIIPDRKDSSEGT